MEVNVSGPRSSKNRAAIWLRHTAAIRHISGIHLKLGVSIPQGYRHVQVYAALVSVAKIGNQARCSSTNECMKKLWCVHNGISFRSEQGWNYDARWKADGTGHDHRWRKPQTDKCYMFSLDAEPRSEFIYTRVCVRKNVCAYKHTYTHTQGMWVEGRRLWGKRSIKRMDQMRAIEYMCPGSRSEDCLAEKGTSKGEEWHHDMYA